MTDKTTRILSISALSCSLVAISLYAFQSSPENSEIEYADRIEELEQEISYLRSGGFEGREEPSEGDPSNLEPQIAFSREPEYAVARARSVDRDVDEMRWTMTVRGFMPATSEHIKRSEETIFDKNGDIKPKLVALRVLKRSDQLSDDVVREMISVFNGTDSHRMQEEILDHLDDVTTPELAPTLLRASAESPSSRVRREAIDAMSGFLPDPDLEDWLRHVQKNDSEKRVRSEAGRLLKKFGQKESN